MSHQEPDAQANIEFLLWINQRTIYKEQVASNTRKSPTSGRLRNSPGRLIPQHTLTLGHRLHRRLL
jgi:hypothetical protein